MIFFILTIIFNFLENIDPYLYMNVMSDCRENFNFFSINKIFILEITKKFHIRIGLNFIVIACKFFLFLFVF